MDKKPKFNKKFHRSANNNVSGQAGKTQNEEEIPCLMFTNLPAEEPQSKVKTMCLQYGPVAAIRYNKQTNRCFVDFTKADDMLNALRGLEKNIHNIKVARGINKRTQNVKNQIHEEANQKLPQVADSKPNADLVPVAQNPPAPKRDNEIKRRKPLREPIMCVVKEDKQGKDKPPNNQEKPAENQIENKPLNETLKSSSNQNQSFNKQQQQQHQQQFANHIQGNQIFNIPNKPHFQQQQFANNNQQNKPPFQQQQQQQFPNNNQMFNQQNKPPFQQQQQFAYHIPGNQIYIQPMQPPFQQQQQFANHIQGNQIYNQPMQPPFQHQQDLGNQMNRKNPFRQPTNPSSQPKEHIGNQMQGKNPFRQPTNPPSQQKQHIGNQMQGKKTPFKQVQEKYQNLKQSQAEVIRNKKQQIEPVQSEILQPYIQKHAINITPGASIKSGVNVTLPISKNPNEKPNLIKKCQLGKCVACERSCSLTCAACGTFICSDECQMKSWEKHRLVCKKISYESANGQRLMDAKNLNRPYPELPDNGAFVKIMSISKANVVFVRPTSDMEDKAFLDLLSKINFEGATLPTLIHAPKMGQIVVAQFENSFHRAQVLDATNQLKIRIIFLDFGELTEKALFNLYEAPEDYMYIPRIVMPVILKGVADLYTTVSVRSYLKALVEDMTLKICYVPEDFLKEKNAYAVELIDKITKKNINELINSMCIPQTQEFQLKKLPLKTGKNIELLIMDNSNLTEGYLYCTLKSLMRELKKTQADIAAFIKESKNNAADYVPVVGKYCLVKIKEDEDWHRGKVLNISETNMCTVILFDLGKEKTVESKDVFSYPQQFTCPIGTRLCQIKGFSQESDISRLKTLLQEGTTINCASVEHQIKENGDEYYILDVNEYLNAQNDDSINIIYM